MFAVALMYSGSAGGGECQMPAQTMLHAAGGEYDFVQFRLPKTCNFVQFILHKTCNFVQFRMIFLAYMNKFYYLCSGF